MEKTKIEEELNKAKKEKEIYLENLETKQQLKKVMKKNLGLPLICAAGAYVLGLIVSKGNLHVDYGNFILFSTVVVEAIAARITMDDLCKYFEIKEELKGVSLDELNMLIEQKQYEKEKVLEKENHVENICKVNVEEESFSLAYETKSKAKVLCKKMNEGSNKN